MRTAPKTPAPPDENYYLNHETKPFPSLEAARLEAARRQYLGEHKSFQILHQGRVVGLKRY